MYDIWTYIADDNPNAADKILARFERTFQMLARQPLIGEARDDLGREIRFVVERPYGIYYRPLSPGNPPVEILRVLHGARDVRPDMF